MKDAKKCPTCKNKTLRYYPDGWWRCDECNKVRGFRDYEPEQAYGTAHDLREHMRHGGTREDY